MATSRPEGARECIERLPEAGKNYGYKRRPSGGSCGLWQRNVAITKPQPRREAVRGINTSASLSCPQSPEPSGKLEDEGSQKTQSTKVNFLEAKSKMEKARECV